eukprot:343545-Amphidinium_carterae.1
MPHKYGVLLRTANNSKSCYFPSKAFFWRRLLATTLTVSHSYGSDGQTIGCSFKGAMSRESHAKGKDIKIRAVV